MKHLSVLFLAVAFVVGACSATSGGLGSLPPARSADPAVGVGSPDLTPDATTDPSTDPATSPGSSPDASAAPSPAGGTTIVRAYFFLAGAQGTAGLVPVLREIPSTKAVATAAVTALLDGPNARERTTDPAISTVVPAGSRLLDLSVKDGVATVDLSSEFESGGGTASVLGRLAQVVYTLTQFPTINSVLFEIDGQRVKAFGGEGVVLDKPVGRADYVDQLPVIFADRPAWGAGFGNPGRVAGNADVFEAQFNVTLIDGSGHKLFDGPAHASCGTGCRGTFDFTVPYNVSKAQWGTLRLWDASEKDGSPEMIRDYPVWLTPAG
ncbi:MAG TPA: GerMN domain-containing protein [Candidatus Limnocylindrales bacterium]|nr:GerMN domain-containing protein [Candidatus Limnocylindrales bacterium]